MASCFEGTQPRGKEEGARGNLGGDARLDYMPPAGELLSEGSSTDTVIEMRRLSSIEADTVPLARDIDLSDIHIADDFVDDEAACRVAWSRAVSDAATCRTRPTRVHMRRPRDRSVGAIRSKAST